MSHVLHRLEMTAYDFALFHSPYPESRFTKPEVYQRVCPTLSPEKDESDQYQASVLFMRKTKAIVEFVQHWTYLVSNITLLDNEIRVEAAGNETVDSRHDQSILSCLLKCRYGEPHRLAILAPGADNGTNLDYGNPDSLRWHLTFFRMQRPNGVIQRPHIHKHRRKSLPHARYPMPLQIEMI